MSTDRHVEPAAHTAPLTPPFPRVFYVANAIELFERLAFYGVYVNLAVYLTTNVGLRVQENGVLLGLFAIGRAWFPVVVGGAADRIGFRKSLVIAFVLYALAYGALFAAPTRPLAYAAVIGMSLGGSFMKPVISGCVKRYSPKGRETAGFSVFYAMVNAGSVVGKTLAKLVRTRISLRGTMVTSIVASVAALALAVFAFVEPADARESDATIRPVQPSTRELLAMYATALRNRRLVVFLALTSGYYLLIEQFYQTFPLYILRVLGPSAPREYITLINPLAIATLQVGVTHLTRRVRPLAGIAAGIFLGALSMFAMGLFPTLAGACLSFFVFALAEMLLSPRYYHYISSFAPRGSEGLYMGLALAPAGLGGLVGGALSGQLVARFLPAHGVQRPLRVWGTYAVIGLVCAGSIALFRAVTREQAGA